MFTSMKMDQYYIFFFFETADFFDIHGNSFCKFENVEVSDMHSVFSGSMAFYGGL